MNTKRKYHCTKMKFSINDFFSKYDQICNAVQCIHFENTTRNSVILPNFLVWKCDGKARFPIVLDDSIMWEIVPFLKISIPGY